MSLIKRIGTGIGLLILIVIILVIVESAGGYDFGFGVYPKDDQPDDDDTEFPIPDDDDDTEIPIPIPDDDDDDTEFPIPIPDDDDDIPIPIPDDDDDEPEFPYCLPEGQQDDGGYYCIDEDNELVWENKRDTGCESTSEYDGSSNNRIRAEWLHGWTNKEHVFNVGAFRNTETNSSYNWDVAPQIKFVFVNQPTLYLFSGRDFTGTCAKFDYKTYKNVTIPNTQFPYKPKSLIVDNKNAVVRTNENKGCPRLFSTLNCPNY